MEIETILKLLIIILLCGTSFAWYQTYQVFAKKDIACSGDKCGNIFTSKCFIGAVFFTVAFSLAVYIFTLI